MTPELQQVIHEAHPELSFCEMAGRPLEHSKKTTLGEQERVATLVGGASQKALRAGRTDFLDACAALWTPNGFCEAKQNALPFCRSSIRAVSNGNVGLSGVQRITR
jgi:predicted RNase H-like nuclease